METSNNFVCESSELTHGYRLKNHHYQCRYCPVTFAADEVYPHDGHFFTAEAMIRQHVAQVHHGALAALVAQPAGQLGVSSSQQTVLQLFAQGLSDTVIAQRLKVSPSTIRNYRFKFREKAQQAQQFLAAMTLLAMPDALIIPHDGAKMVDDRYAITPEERTKTLKSFMDADGRVTNWPSKEKRKLIILSEIFKGFDPQKNYSETAVNEILKQHVEDYVTVRRNLIEYGFLDRTADGRTYWVKASGPRI